LRSSEVNLLEDKGTSNVGNQRFKKIAHPCRLGRPCVAGSTKWTVIARSEALAFAIEKKSHRQWQEVVLPPPSGNPASPPLPPDPSPTNPFHPSAGLCHPPPPRPLTPATPACWPTRSSKEGCLSPPAGPARHPRRRRGWRAVAAAAGVWADKCWGAPGDAERRETERRETEARAARHPPGKISPANQF